MPETGSLDLLSIDELASILDGKAPVPEPEPTQPEAETAQPKDETVPPEEIPQPSATEGTKEPEPTADELDRKILQAQVEEARALAKKHEQVAGRSAGELGFLRQRVQELQSLFEARPAQDPEYAEEPRAPAPPKSQADEETRAYTREIAVERGASKFHALHSDIQAHIQNIGEYLKEQDFSYRQSAGPLEAERETLRILEEAYWDAKAKSHRTALEVHQKTRADQFARMQEAKKRATISGSSSHAAPAPKPKTLDDMSIEELGKELDRLTRK